MVNTNRATAGTVKTENRYADKAAYTTASARLALLSACASGPSVLTWMVLMAKCINLRLRRPSRSTLSER